MSYWKRATNPEKKVVMLPKRKIKFKMLSENSKKKEHRIIRKTPAVTIVAACNKALTGVGPSIASGSHVWKPICADLPMLPTKRKKAIKSTDL
jgi:hypothetical protein